ncbi:uncharacterized protein BDR25DRAFT_258803 [Lindgomyces ingoldianus]|uniref:Uncharacterized protein n=1 Tax=Lindgomyces ingoldianus TaxID=673940 RepID=A0ACB6R086_9PLEO|nr:uncharacterized protein BDR25DRAFT_258803 [Lindgomyces ingoldianus]KAF2472442.1 hypothetical protein BDR25DRAFT_258803 [Lindgomyces ingoldianus]
MNSAQPRGVHLVGSINLPTTENVFEQIPALLPSRLHRIPDGETGNRHYFIRWQRQLFSSAPQVLAKYDGSGEVTGAQSALTDQQVSTALEKLPELHTQFDDFALESYALFKKNMADGHIASQTRFQVSLPGLVNVMALIAAPFQLRLEPLYEDALARSLKRIQDSITHSELAIQIDVAIEIALIEGAGPWPAYFDPIFSGVIERLSRFANRVANDVELGFHLCYGDTGHRHFVEPKDTRLLVELANALNKSVQRPIQWIHMPVPKGRKDLAYFTPLKELNWKIPELYLGVVHPHDEEGTRERIVTAQQVVQEFGVSSECGLGRTPPEEFGTIMGILKNVSAPVS